MGPTAVVLTSRLFGDGPAALGLGLAVVCAAAAVAGLALLWQPSASQRPLAAAT